MAELTLALPGKGELWGMIALHPTGRIVSLNGSVPVASSQEEAEVLLDHHASLPKFQRTWKDWTVYLVPTHKGRKIR